MMKITAKHLAMAAVMMIIVLLPIFPHALAEENGNAVVNSYQQIEYSAPKPRRISSVKAGLSVPGAISGTENEQPARYDARDLGIVPPVRDQGEYGTCWAHAFISSAEINLCMQGLADADEIDLSELQFLYYSYGKYTDPLGNLGNDLNMAMDVSPLDRGGSHLFTALLADRWSGLTAEQLMTYPDDIGFAMNSFDLDGKNRYTYLGDSYPAEYGSDFAEAHLRNCIAIPYDDVSGIKQAIMDLGSVVSSVYDSDNASYFNTVTNAYFQNVRTTPNHAVTIIGWDDDYPVGNFGTKYRPKHPGAWLVRNSRGADWGNEGYFWLSYEDASLRNDFFAYEFDAADKYNYNYQYDGTASLSGIEFNALDRSGEVSVFTAASDEYINAVNFAPLGDANVDYSVSIYVDPDLSSDFLAQPADAEQCGETVYAGIYTVEFDEPVFVEAGQDFAVVLTVYDCADGNFALFFDGSETTGNWLEAKADNKNTKGYFFCDDSGLIDAAPYGAPRLKAFTTAANGKQPSNFRTALGGDLVFLDWDEVEGADAYEIWAGTDNGGYEILDTTDDICYTYTASKENGLILKYKVRGIFDGVPGRFSLSRTIRFPVEISVEGFDIPGTVYEEADLPLMAGQENEETPDFSAVEQYKTCRLECSFSPENASDKLVSYIVDDPSIAEVDFDGTITAKEPGIATVFAHTRDGDFERIFTITVTKHKHTWSAGTLVKEASCTENGEIDFHCPICNTDKADIIPMKEHIPVVTQLAKSATCTADGNTAEIVCTVCKNVLSEAITLPSTGHTFVFLEKQAADCRQGGCDVYVCKNCGTTEKRNETAAADHDYIPVLTKAPTCSEKGYDLYICRYCAQTQYRNEKTTLAHKFVLFDTKAPSCTESGYELYECINCGKLEKCGETPAYGHADTNNDGRCDGCGTVLDAEAAHEDCDCICHKTGISALIYKLLNLIWKVFGINRECKCGAMHY